MARTLPPVLTQETAKKCRSFVFEAAKRYDLPPVFITAHVPNHRSQLARKEVMRRMIEELGLRRYQVASIFQRDLRRVRRSVIGGSIPMCPNRNPKGGYGWWPTAKMMKERVCAFVLIGNQFVMEFAVISLPKPRNPFLTKKPKPQEDFRDLGFQLELMLPA